MIYYIITFSIIGLISYIRYMNNKKYRNKLINLIYEANKLKPMIYSLLECLYLIDDHNGGSIMFAIKDSDNKIISFIINISGKCKTLPNPHNILFMLYCVEIYSDILDDQDLNKWIYDNKINTYSMYITTTNKLHSVLNERNSLSKKNYERFHDADLYF